MSMSKEGAEYRKQMLRRLKKKYQDSPPSEVLEAEKVIAKFRAEEAHDCEVIARLETAECPASVCRECFYLRGLSVRLTAIPGDDEVDRFRCPECKAIYEQPS